MEKELTDSWLPTWINTYANQHPDPITLQKIIEGIVSEYEEKEKQQLFEYQQRSNKRNIPDKDGFITVIHTNPSKKRPFYHNSTIHKSDKNQEILNFYTSVSKLDSKYTNELISKHEQTRLRTARIKRNRKEVM